jgi:hypothetical protein
MKNDEHIFRYVLSVGNDGATIGNDSSNLP